MEHSIIPSHNAFERGDIEEGVRRFINGVLGKGEYEKLPPNVHTAMLENARELQEEVKAMATNGKRFFPPFTCEEASNMRVSTLLLDGE